MRAVLQADRLVLRPWPRLWPIYLLPFRPDLPPPHSLSLSLSPPAAGRARTRGTSAAGAGGGHTAPHQERRHYGQLRPVSASCTAHAWWGRRALRWRWALRRAPRAMPAAPPSARACSCMHPPRQCLTARLALRALALSPLPSLTPLQAAPRTQRPLPLASCAQKPQVLTLSPAPVR